MRRFASALAVAAVAPAVAVGVGERRQPPASARRPGAADGRELAALSRSRRAASLASQRIYFVMTGPVRERRPVQRPRRAAPARASVTGYDPADTGYFHGGDLKGLTGGCTTGTGSRGSRTSASPRSG